MKRTALALVAIIVAALATTGCWEKKVTVQTGEKVVCTYGETISSTVGPKEVPESQASKYKITVKTITCARHRTLEALYSAAQKAITDGNLKSAREKLAQVVELDSKFRKAAEQLKTIDAGQTPSADTTAPPSTPSGGGGAPEAPAASLAAWVPDTLTGYTAQPIIADPVALTRDYLPSKPGKVAAIVVVVEQYPTANSAKQRMLETISKAYSADRSSITVEGRTLQFGTTGGGRFAAVAWNEGSIGVAIEAAASTGNSAAGLKDELAKVAAELIR